MIFPMNFNKELEKLAQLATKEKWSFEGRNNYSILNNYILKTYDRLLCERKVLQAYDYSIFNTGLFTDDCEPIYCYSKRDYDLKEYKFEKFCIKCDLISTIGADISLPDKANYHRHPEILVFNPNYQIYVNLKRILSGEDNLNKIPKEIRNSKHLKNIFVGAINIMKKQISENYKLAIPSYFNENFNEKIQLLVPLCLIDCTTPDLVLALTKNSCGNLYLCDTCLDLKTAYNNARLIAPLENTWLSQNII